MNDEMSHKNVWFVEITNENATVEEGPAATREQADELMTVLGGRVDSDETDGCFNVVLPDCLDDLMQNYGVEGSLTVHCGGNGHVLTITFGNA